MVLAIGIVDLIWSRQAGLTFVGWTHPAFAIAACALLGTVYSTLRTEPPLAEMASCAGLWIGFTAVGCVLTYLAASVSRPPADLALSAFDQHVGFDWVAWANTIHRHRLLTVVLRLAYSSLAPQIVASVLLLASRPDRGRNDELLINAVLALILTALMSATWPALGPWVQFGYQDIPPDDTLYVADILTLRGGTTATFALTHMQGIVSFPSYHTVLAILLIHAHRGQWYLPLVLALNGLMLVSLPSEGGHYLTDLIAGSGVAVAAIATGHIVRCFIMRPAIPQALAAYGADDAL